MLKDMALDELYGILIAVEYRRCQSRLLNSVCGDVRGSSDDPRLADAFESGYQAAIEVVYKTLDELLAFDFPDELGWEPLVAGLVLEAGRIAGPALAVMHDLAQDE